MTYEDAYRILGTFGRKVALGTNSLDRGEITKAAYVAAMQALLEETLRDLGLSQEKKHEQI